jgi:hypothetical protein
MKKLIPIVGISILAVVAAKAQDAAKVDSGHYKVLLDNEYVRVLDVHHKPGEKSPTHSLFHDLLAPERDKQDKETCG